MKIQQKKFSRANNWEIIRNDEFDKTLSNFVLVFGSKELISDPKIFRSIKSDYPNADILLNSTSGEIMDTKVMDDTISLTAILFEKTKITTAITQIDKVKNSYEAGKQLASEIAHKGLKYVMVISDGQKVNGDELVLGLQEHLPAETIITGGLAGDGENFKSTVVGLNEPPIEGRIVAVGFYGSELSVTYGSVGGWNSFGPERLITRSESNVLYELDGKPALDIYKTYLGEYANELPKSGLMFPLSIRVDGSNHSIVRAILGINENEKSVSFGGNMPQGSYAQLMNANYDRLIEGASEAAQNSTNKKVKQPELAILISCMARKLVLDQRVEEEVDVVRGIYGEKTAITGFYSYGEIAPSFNSLKCQLHNQTMTITTLSEN